MASLIDSLCAACPAVVEHEPMARHTSWAIGGPADYYAPVSTRAELAALRQAAAPIPVFFIGSGSNLLVSDRGIRGLVIHLEGDFRTYAFEGHRITVGAGMWMPTLAKFAAERGLAGIESLIGVPGTIGGGLVMNAGTRDGVLGDTVVTVETLDETAKLRTLTKSDLHFTYRHSILEGHWVTGATLELQPSDAATVQGRIAKYLEYRARTQPGATSNCGSTFKNPPEHSAGRLIEEAGLKGSSEGGARVSEKHANFIVNEKKATATDVRTLMKRIQDAVQKKSGVLLEPEVKFVGEWG